MREYPLADLRQRIGVVMQKAVLFQGTIAQNLDAGESGCDRGTVVACD